MTTPPVSSTAIGYAPGTGQQGQPPASQAPKGGSQSPPKPPKILRDSAIIPLILIGTGGYLMWFAVKYWRGTGPATWPSYPVKSVLQGKGIPPNVQATTAETTLDAYESGAASGGGSTYSGPIPYRNPLRQVKGLQAQRIDMGVDYYGAGPIYAVGPGTITEADSSWAGGYGGTGQGTFIAERLSSGPLAGKYIYFAEHINPNVRVGQRVDVNTVIGTMTGGIETGFAAGPTGGTTLAAATGQASSSGDPGANTTAYGRAWSDVLAFLGAPAGKQGGPDTGTLPAGWWTGGDGGNVHGNVTPRQAYVAFRQAGLSRSASIWLTAIAGVESQYSTTALNNDPATGDYSVGLTQINYYQGLYAERAPYIGTPQQLLAGGLNDQARATAWLYNKAGGLGPWQPDITSHKTDQYLPGAMAAAQGGP